MSRFSQIHVESEADQRRKALETMDWLAEARRRSADELDDGDTIGDTGCDCDPPG